MGKKVKGRTSVHFRRPKTFRLKKNPTYQKKVALSAGKKDSYAIVKYPLTTEKAMKLVESQNTLTFIVDMKAVLELYDINAARINTLVTPKAEKKAYIKLGPEADALDFANKIGIL